MTGVRTRSRTRFRRFLLVVIPVVLIGCLVAAGIAAWPGSGARSSTVVQRGIADPFVTVMSKAQQQVKLREIGSQLHAGVVRFFVSWATAEPTQGPLNVSSAYMTSVTSAIDIARADGLKVMITFQSVPQWASDSTYWTSPPGGGTWTLKAPEYQSHDAMTDPDGVNAFGTFCGEFATHVKGKVYAYEVWNEPNLWLSLYPQKTDKDPDFAAHLYIKMLKSCHDGIHAADPAALIVAGATAPMGSDAGDGAGTLLSTSPQRFADVLKAANVESLFNAYSHHPYTPFPTSNLGPSAAPFDPQRTVILQNLSTLLKVFPDKPFFLTEYGYQTEACHSFQGQHITEIQQAVYLQQAYAYAARYSQVKMLLWFLVKDFRPAGDPDPKNGFYTGLRYSSGVAKRAWFAFAQGNLLTLNGPTSIKRGKYVILTGTLSSSSAGGGLAGKQLVVLGHVKGKPWATLTTISTRTRGAFSVRLWPKASTNYEVAWLGVVTSKIRYVAVK
jgi:hypothetical protein